MPPPHGYLDPSHFPARCRRPLGVGGGSADDGSFRLTRNASHPTPAATLDIGRAQKSIFVARYLRLRELQREIEEGPNVMEASNQAPAPSSPTANGEIASNRREEQEMFVLCLRILQSALVFVNTLVLQQILAEDGWPSSSPKPAGAG
ncbi:Tn3 family transposase [Actinomadura nitritigenes]|uniref:Tn3 family transposase n=1 Tax=Actinomadura nitritigenes TaxID=134602 RepID=UPI003D901506